jgi:hypothetical protein
LIAALGNFERVQAIGRVRIAAPFGVIAVAHAISAVKRLRIVPASQPSR